MIHVYRELQDLGHEVALHTDALSVYQRHGVDGAAALVSELGWLRENGIEVRGTVAHGSRSAFGAENFEIFRGRRAGEARSADPALARPAGFVHRGRPARLRELCEDDLGLAFEGNDIFFQSEVPVE